MLKFFFEKFFGEVLDLYQLPIERNFEYLEKNGVLQFLDRLAGPDDNAVHEQVTKNSSWDLNPGPLAYRAKAIDFREKFFKNRIFLRAMQNIETQNNF